MMAAVFNHKEDSSMGRRSNFSSKQKAEVVLSVLTKQVTIAEVCRRHGITETTFNRWREQALEAMERGLARWPDLRLL
jgi:transposase-like protein